MNIATDLPSRRVNGRMWVAGQSGNPAGRPVGARGRFSQQFIEDMRASWERHGATVMDRVAVEYPDRYLGSGPFDSEGSYSDDRGGLWRARSRVHGNLAGY
jgi:hypothetical protein